LFDAHHNGPAWRAKPCGYWPFGLAGTSTKPQTDSGENDAMDG
jgi:hypothetical protein